MVLKLGGERERLGGRERLKSQGYHAIYFAYYDRVQLESKSAGDGNSPGLTSSAVTFYSKVTGTLLEILRI